MNKDKKTTTAVVGQQQPVPATVVSQAPPISVAVAPKLAATIEENLPKHHQQDELMPTIRPPAGSFSGCSMDAGDEDTDEHLQVFEIIFLIQIFLRIFPHIELYVLLGVKSGES